MADHTIPTPGTPLPWLQKVEPISYPECSDQDLPVVIRGANGAEVTTIYERWGESGPSCEQDAAYIVTACNLFPELVETGTDALHELDSIIRCVSNLTARKEMQAVADRLRDALAKAGA